MIPRHHPGEELILAHVTGGLLVPMDVAVAAHLSLCPQCRRTAACFMATGGVLLEQMDSTPLRSGSMEAALARLDEATHTTGPMPPDTEDSETDLETQRLLPAPLRKFVGAQPGTLSWRSSRPDVSVCTLATEEEYGAEAVLVRIGAGGHYPYHIHDEFGLTLVLAGGMSDQNGHYRRGDILVTEPGDAHGTVMDEDEDCLCYGVTYSAAPKARTSGQSA